jgi:uncharacterized protein (DUF2235 family)
MKNLIICCDGTWKRADDQYVSNIEKIARAIETTPAGGNMQIVFYTSGVGTGATAAERILGGAFGIGLDAAIVSAYRFLALNYEPGDSVFVFGFSRGAYTARSLVGMTKAIGLLTPDGLADNKLRSAISLYRGRPRPDEEPSPDFRRAKEDFATSCYSDEDVEIRFLGVFDTVGALGVPGLSRQKYKFHDVTLNQRVKCARQALAIDEQRRTFAPCIWQQVRGDEGTPENALTDVKQVWFEGVHTDIGGGYEESALSDLVLNWMVGEAKQCGLVIDSARLAKGQRSSPLVVHNSLTLAYRVMNALSRGQQKFRRFPKAAIWRFRGDRRLLESSAEDWGVAIASGAHRRWTDAADMGEPSAVNVSWWIQWLGDHGLDPSARVEKVD